MTAEELRALQAPLKSRYRDDPKAALWTLTARARLGVATVTAEVGTHSGPVVAGLHPATGGNGREACSGDMLLEALVACAGVTLSAVATALAVPLRAGTVVAEGDLDFRGTLGVARDAPVGFAAIRLRFALDTDAPAADLDKLIALTERYCVVYQTLRGGPAMSVSHSVIPRAA
ncbi:MAG: OsmC family protein [Alphaproteobacteria bacterium]|nr:OsmC family protein [Alphaproteobacteria bacterium]